MSSRKRLGKNHASNWKIGWFAINRKSDPVAYAWQSPKRGWRQIWLRAWRTDWACAIFDKITAVYGQIDENESSVRKWLARKMPFTDKCFKKPALSVNPHHNGQKFTDKSLENVGLSVKCVLLTDKSSKIGSLSVNLSEILDWSVEKSYSQIDCIVRHLIYFKRKTGLFTGLILAKNHIMIGLSLSSRPQKWVRHENVLLMKIN